MLSPLVAIISLLSAPGALPAPLLDTTRFEHILSTGPFGLPNRGRSLDWAVLNNAPDSQQVRVTIWELSLTGDKTATDPGPLTFWVGAGWTFHNANQIAGNGPFHLGFYYEVVVEVNTRLVLPSVQVWSDDRGSIIPGTRIGPTGFVEIKP